MTTIKVNKKYYTIPNDWNELSQKQLLEVMEVLFLKQYNEEQIVLKLLKVLLNFSYWQFFRCKPEELEEYIYLTNFLIKENTLIKCLMPFYTHDKVSYFGPSDEMSNLVMEEFYFTEDYYMQWQEDRSVTSLLNNLVAVLYRQAKDNYDFEKNADGDPRIAFNENICAHYALKSVVAWPMNVKLAIATWYAGYRQHLIQLYPEVFSQSGGDPTRFGLLSVIRNIAMKGVHGNFESVEKKYVNLIMMELTEIIEENKKPGKEFSLS